MDVAALASLVSLSGLACGWIAGLARMIRVAGRKPRQGAL